MRDRVRGLASAEPRAAQDEAGRVLDQTGDRWRHVVAVAERAESIAGAVPAQDRDLLVAAAWLHDIGYGLVDSGLHSLDGARHLRSLGTADRLCRLVAHHTAAIVEAEARGLAGELAAEFQPEYSLVADALTYADLTVGPQGQPMTVEDRLAEILRRYPPDHVVHQSILRARPGLTATAARAERRLTLSTRATRASTHLPEASCRPPGPTGSPGERQAAPVDPRAGPAADQRLLKTRPRTQRPGSPGRSRRDANDSVGVRPTPSPARVRDRHRRHLRHLPWTHKTDCQGPGRRASQLACTPSNKRPMGGAGRSSSGLGRHARQ